MPSPPPDSRSPTAVIINPTTSVEGDTAIQASTAEPTANGTSILSTGSGASTRLDKRQHVPPGGCHVGDHWLRCLPDIEKKHLLQWEANAVAKYGDDLLIITWQTPEGIFWLFQTAEINFHATYHGNPHDDHILDMFPGVRAGFAKEVVYRELIPDWENLPPPNGDTVVDDIMLNQDPESGDAF
jgi:hypothetical protein